MRYHPIKVLYIGGYTRSGSTLLDQLLGQIDGMFSVGELRHIWNNSFENNHLCGCGKPFRECEFWNEVINEAFGGFERLDIARIKSLKHNADRMRYMPYLMYANKPTFYKKRFDAYAKILGELYKAIHKVSDCEIILDSSKDPSHGFILNAMSEIDLYCIHLVRDSRAVAFSWMRKKIKPEIHWTKEYMPRNHPVKSALEWTVMNLSVQTLTHMNNHCVFLRYEDYVASPHKVLTQCLKRLGLGQQDLDFLNSPRIGLKVKHSVSGNPIRFSNEISGIEQDTEWQEKMLKYQKLWVTALTFPLLFKYGYIGKKKLVLQDG
ncbi:MAG: sulfotransferase [Thermodesulfobacteriota bacterium]